MYCKVTQVRLNVRAQSDIIENSNKPFYLVDNIKVLCVKITLKSNLFLLQAKALPCALHSPENKSPAEMIKLTFHDSP